MPAETVIEEDETTSEKPVAPQPMTTPAWPISWLALSVLIACPFARAVLSEVFPASVWPCRKACNGERLREVTTSGNLSQRVAKGLLQIMLSTSVGGVRRG